MLELTDTNLKQTRFSQEIFTEGRHKEGLLLILRLLQRRCGEIMSAAKERITRLSLPQQEALGEALLEFKGAAALEQWLATHARE